MRKLNVLLYIIGAVQLVLGALYLFMPLQFLTLQGHPPASPDIAYPLGMLAARFVAYGIGMLFIARTADKTAQAFWINNMILIQAIDLAVGLFYTATGVIALANSAFPMFNATLFIVLLSLWRPRAAPAQPGIAPAGD